MEKSALQIARAAYQPKLPKALQGPVKAVEGAATQSVGNQEEIKALFPNTYGMPVITFEAGEAQELPAFNVGVSFLAVRLLAVTTLSLVSSTA